MTIRRRMNIQKGTSIPQRMSIRRRKGLINQKAMLLLRDILLQKTEHRTQGRSKVILPVRNGVAKKKKLNGFLNVHSDHPSRAALCFEGYFIAFNNLVFDFRNVDE